MRQEDKPVHDAGGTAPTPSPSLRDAYTGSTASRAVHALRQATGRIGLSMTPARIVGTIGATAFLAGIVVLGIDTFATELDTFAAFGLAKRIILPAMYCAFALMLVWPSRTRRRTTQLRPPVWWWVLLAALVASSAQSIALGPGPLLPFLQGLALFGGALVIALAGYLSPDWTPAQARNLFLVLAMAGALAGAARTTGYAPFVSILVPTTGAGIYLALKLPRYRRWLVTLALVLCAAVYLATFGRQESSPMSLAVLAEIVSAVVLLLILGPPAALRRLFALGAAVLLPCFAVAAGYAPMFLGASDYVDITIAHRGYEAHAVMNAVFASPWTALFGLGPGGTVDLTSSPDGPTLAHSGRDLAAVPSVHLLSSYVLLKLGLLGVIALIAILVAIARQIWAVASDVDAKAFDGALLFYVVCGLASAIPAATNLFANPLPLLFLGILSARISSTRILSVSSDEPAQRTTRLLRRARAGGLLVVVTAAAVMATLVLDRKADLLPVARGEPQNPWRPVALFIGDNSTQGAATVNGSGRFTALIAEAESWHELNLGLGGTGYAASASNEPWACGRDYCPPYAEMIDEATKFDPNFVVVSGGRHDLPHITDPGFSQKVNAFFRSLQHAFPNAEIIAMSPIWDDDPVPDSMTTLRTVVRQAVAAIGGTYIDLGDPLLGHPELVAADIWPNDLGHAKIARLFLAAYAEIPTPVSAGAE